MTWRGSCWAGYSTLASASSSPGRRRRTLGHAGSATGRAVLAVAQIVRRPADLGLEQVGCSGRPPVRNVRRSADRRHGALRRWFGAGRRWSPYRRRAGRPEDEHDARGLLIFDDDPAQRPETARATLQLRHPQRRERRRVTFLSVAWGAGATRRSSVGGGLVALALAFLVAETAAAGAACTSAPRRGQSSNCSARASCGGHWPGRVPVADRRRPRPRYARIHQILVLRDDEARAAGSTLPSTGSSSRWASCRDGEHDPAAARLRRLSDGPAARPAPAAVDGRLSGDGLAAGLRGRPRRLGADHQPRLRRRVHRCSPGDARSDGCLRRDLLRLPVGQHGGGAWPTADLPPQCRTRPDPAHHPEPVLPPPLGFHGRRLGNACDRDLRRRSDLEGRGREARVQARAFWAVWPGLRWRPPG